ncbi:hypothetical protein ACFPYI_07335 [Halomarina salina]|uniref:AlkP-core domain protein n=1 Tax=Halomarina salina TaxID=1872699 RepID=A0ABD5RLC3_9EURY|nr:hypothetical protein [Halomarina salina]
MSIRAALNTHLTQQYEELAEYYDSPMWWYNQTKQYALFPLHRLRYAGQGYTRILDEDWDSLFVLDGCRADLFREVADVSRFDEYTEVNSGASATKEWVGQQFYGRAHSDTIYVNGNAVVSENVTGAFREFIDVWRDAYDEERRLIPAEPVAEAARHAREEHPDARLIVHFCQPHYPFLSAPELQFDGSDGGPSNVWQALRQGKAALDDVWEAYAENLRYVLEVAEPLAEEFGERTVLTADHGNLVGERIYPVPLRQWGHPPGLRHPNLTTVPWAVVDGERTTKQSVDADVNEQLSALGYR